MSIRSEFLIAIKEVCRCCISDAVFFNCSQTKFSNYSHVVFVMRVLSWSDFLL